LQQRCVLCVAGFAGALTHARAHDAPQRWALQPDLCQLQHRLSVAARLQRALLRSVTQHCFRHTQRSLRARRRCCRAGTAALLAARFAGGSQSACCATTRASRQPWWLLGAYRGCG
jgi:hypothetical protein